MSITDPQTKLRKLAITANRTLLQMKDLREQLWFFRRMSDLQIAEPYAAEFMLQRILSSPYDEIVVFKYLHAITVLREQTFPSPCFDKALHFLLANQSLSAEMQHKQIWGLQTILHIAVVLFGLKSYESEFQKLLAISAQIQGFYKKKHSAKIRQVKDVLGDLYSDMQFNRVIEGIYKVDAYLPDERLVLEILDESHFNSSDRPRLQKIKMKQVLEAQGYRVHLLDVRRLDLKKQDWRDDLN